MDEPLGSSTWRFYLDLSGEHPLARGLVDAFAERAQRDGGSLWAWVIRGLVRSALPCQLDLHGRGGSLYRARLRLPWPWRWLVQGGLRGPDGKPLAFRRDGDFVEGRASQEAPPGIDYAMDPTASVLASVVSPVHAGAPAGTSQMEIHLQAAHDTGGDVLVEVACPDEPTAEFTAPVVDQQVRSELTRAVPGIKVDGTAASQGRFVTGIYAVTLPTGWASVIEAAFARAQLAGLTRGQLTG